MKVEISINDNFISTHIVPCINKFLDHETYEDRRAHEGFKTDIFISHEMFK